MEKVFGLLVLSANNKGLADFGTKPGGRRNLAGGVNRRKKWKMRQAPAGATEWHRSNFRRPSGARALNCAKPVVCTTG